MFDVIQIFFLSITYIAIVITSYVNIKKKLIAIPYCAILMNFAWEINALIESEGFWGHIVWICLDSLIVIHAIVTMQGIGEKILFIFAALILTTFLFVVFNFLPMGMLISVFLIDLMMAILFALERKQLLENGRLFIASTKLIGDTAAAIYYAPYSFAVLVVGIAVFVINIKYLLDCARDKIMNQEKQ